MILVFGSSARKRVFGVMNITVGRYRSPDPCELHALEYFDLTRSGQTYETYTFGMTVVTLYKTPRQTDMASKATRFTAVFKI